MPKQPSPDDALSHWYALLENFQTSSVDFYASVEDAVKSREVSDCEFSRIDWREGGVLSAQREYLRVERGRHVFDICAAPFGKGFFISWWLATPSSSLGPLFLLLLTIAVLVLLIASISAFGFLAGLFVAVIGIPLLFWLAVLFIKGSAKEGWDDPLVAMPFLGPVYERLFRPETYYKVHTALMFQEAIRRAVLEVVDGLTSAKGLRVLSELERKPILREFHKR